VRLSNDIAETHFNRGVALATLNCMDQAMAAWQRALDLNFRDVRLYNYLGIADHPLLVEESAGWTRKFGTSSKASRLVSGTNPAYLELEERIAEWKGSEAALLFGSGYMANTGIEEI